MRRGSSRVLQRNRRCRLTQFCNHSGAFAKPMRPGHTASSIHNECHFPLKNLGADAAGLAEANFFFGFHGISKDL